MNKKIMPTSTLLNPVPVVMISCAGKDKEKPESRPNIVTVAWTGTINSEPPMVSISLRKSRHSYPLIEETGEFVINLVSESLCKAVDYCGVKSGADEDKFASLALHAAPASGLQYAPAIDEAPISLSCKVISKTELGSHDMFIAEVVSTEVDERLFDEKGKICLEKANLVAYVHGEYFSLGKMLGFFGYSVASKDVLERRMPKTKTIKSEQKGKQGRQSVTKTAPAKTKKKKTK